MKHNRLTTAGVLVPVALALAILFAGAAVGDTIVTFPDANLEAGVRSALGIAAPTPITATAMLGLTSLSVPFTGITDLTGIEYATNLTKLWVGGNNIGSLAPVAGLGNLTFLAIDHVPTALGLAPLAGLPSLQTLIAEESGISDIMPLSGLTSLRELSLQQNLIADIGPLKNLPMLQYLDITYNRIAALPVLGAPALETIYLWGNDIADISNLAASGLPRLDCLDLRGNPLNQDAYDVYIPQLMASHPDSRIVYGPIPEPGTLLLLGAGMLWGATRLRFLKLPHGIAVRAKNNLCAFGMAVPTRVKNWAIIAVVAACLCPASVLADVQWQAASGYWHDAGNWNPWGVPGSNDTAWVHNGGTATYVAGDNYYVSTLKVEGTGAGQNSSVQHTGGTLRVYNIAYAGANYANTGTYALSGGTFHSAYTYVGSATSGVFTHSGGSHQIDNNLSVGVNASGTGTYTMSGSDSPSLSVGGSIRVGESGTGTFNQSVGTVSNNSGTVYIGRNYGSHGTYNFSGGALYTQTVDIGSGGTGALNWTGGDLYVGTAVRVHSGGTMTVEKDWGFTRALTVDGGDLDLGTHALAVRSLDALAVCTLSDGSLTAGSIDVSITSSGYQGTLTWTGGDLIAGTITVNPGGKLSVGADKTFGGNVYVNGGNVSGNLGTIEVTSGHTLTLTGTFGETANSQTITKTGAGTLIISGTQTHSAGAQLAVTAGTVELNSAAGDGTTHNLEVVVSSGATAKFGETQDLAKLTAAGGTIWVADGKTVTVWGEFSVSATGQTLTKTGPGTLVIKGAQNHQTTTTLSIEAGSVTLETDAGGATTPTCKLALVLSSSATVDFASTQHLAALTLNGTATVTLAEGYLTLATGALTIAGGSTPTARLDLNDGFLAVDYSSESPVVDDIRQWMLAGRNGGDWLGMGITSGVAAAHTVLYAIGYVDNYMLPAEMRFATFGGEAVDVSSVLVRFTWGADVTLDGKVGDADSTVIGANYDGGATTGHYWWEGDLNGDDRISDADVTILGALYSRSWAVIEVVDPDPPGAAVNSIIIAFSRPVDNFDLSDLVLTRGGEAVSLSSANLDGGNMNFTLSGLSGLTGTAGTYVLTLSGSGITGFVGADVSQTWDR